MTWAVYDGDVPNFAGFSFHVGMGNDRFVWKSGLLVYCVGPQQRPKMEVQSCFTAEACRLDKAHDGT